MYGNGDGINANDDVNNQYYNNYNEDMILDSNKEIILREQNDVDWECKQGLARGFNKINIFEAMYYT